MNLYNTPFKNTRTDILHKLFGALFTSCIIQIIPYQTILFSKCMVFHYKDIPLLI